MQPAFYVAEKYTFHSHALNKIDLYCFIIQFMK